MKKMTDTQRHSLSVRAGRRKPVPVLMEENSFIYTEPDYRPTRTDVWTTTPTSLRYQLKTAAGVVQESDDSKQHTEKASSFQVCYRRMLK